jgi:hypothetical protein
MSAPSAIRWLCLGLFGLLALVACDGQVGNGQESEAALPAGGTPTPGVVPTPAVPAVDLVLTEQDVSVAPLPLRAGFPFSVTVVIHNNADAPATDVPVIIHLSAEQEGIAYTPFLRVLTVTLPASQALPIEVPVNWNFSGGDHRLWVQVNRLPDAWQARTSTWPEANTSDNVALLDLVVDPFDAYTSDLCPGRVDVEIGPVDVLPEPDRQRVWARVHNVGNRALYNLPVVVLGDHLSGVAYTPAIPPCGGTADVYVELDRLFHQGESLTVLVNPSEWVGGVPEDDIENNQVTVVAGLAPGFVIPPGSGLEDYDFSISAADIEMPEPWLAYVTVRNLGTRDAAMVPIRVENEAGRKLADAIPLVQGNGQGVAAIRVGYLWTRGGTLTFTVNPEDAEGGYPETNRGNNVVTFVLP